MKFAALLVLAGFLVGCNRDAFKESDQKYMNPITDETVQSTNGLEPAPRFDLHEARPPSETPGAAGSSRDIRIETPSEPVAPNDQNQGNN